MGKITRRNTIFLVVILLVITVIGISVGLTFSNTTVQNESFLPNEPEIDTLYNQIEESKRINDESEKPYIPKPPTWDNAAGPVVIDNHEYLLGQKIFVNISKLTEDDKGRIDVYKPVKNSEYMFLYSSIGFDGSQIRNNYYFTPNLSAIKGICHPDDLVGEWVMKIKDTQYPDLTFTIINEKMPGFESNYEPIQKGIGEC